MQLIVVIPIVIGVVYSCTDGKYGTDEIFSPPDTLPFSRYDEADVNVYFYFPDNIEEYSGRITGASSCGAIAHNCACNKGQHGNRDWGYVYCIIEGGPGCDRKIS